MKPMLLIALLLTTLLPAQTTDKDKANSQRLLGAWEMVSADYGQGNRPLTNRERKVFTPKHFMWIRFDKNGNTLGEGGGTYLFSGTAMVEHLEFIDKRENFLVDKDQSLQITFPSEEIFVSSGVLSSGQHISEVWKRID